jgi:dolichol kinase
VLAIGVFVSHAGAESTLAQAMVAGALVVALVVDWIRLRFVVANITFFRVFSDLASPREATKLASSTWFLIGTLAVLVIAPPRLFFPTMLAFAFADPAAHVVGRLLGTRRLGKGTWEGTAVFFLVAATVLTPLAGIGAALIAAVAAAAVEVLSVGLDDNLTVPPVIAIVLWLAGG